MKRVLFYTRPAHFDTALSFIRAISKHVELHVMIELGPESWHSALFDIGPLALPAGVHPAETILRDSFPAALHEYWSGTSSIRFVVHSSNTVHPRTWSVGREAAAAIRALAPDLIHLDEVGLRFAPVVTGIGRIPLLVSVHDPQSHSGEQNWRRSLARRLVYRRVGHFILHSGVFRPHFARRYKVPLARISTVPLGSLDIWRLASEIRCLEEPRTVLFFGRISQYKGIDTLYAAAELLAERLSELRLIVAGRPAPNYALPVAPELSNGGVVQLIDRYIPNSELSCLFGRATVVVCPYKDATQSAVLLTAYAFRKSVVATAVGGLPEYVKHGATGLLVPPANPVALAEAIGELLASPARRASMSEEIGEMSRDLLSWERIASRVAALYGRVLTRPFQSRG